MGCLPVVLQLPVFFALFSVLRAIAEWKPGQPPKYGLTYQMVATARHAKILGVTISDKFLFSSTTPTHAKVVIFIFVLISMATTYLTVRQSMKRGMMPATTPDNPMGQSQKYMMYIMPVFALSGLYWPFGLVLYWVTTNLWTLGQQWLLFRRYPQPAAAGAAGAPAPAIAPTVTSKPKRPGSQGPRPARGAGNQDGAKSDGTSQANGAARADSAAPENANGTQPRSARKAASSPARASADQGAQPPANGSGAGGMLRRLGKGRAEPAPPPPEPEVKLVRQQKQRQSRSKRSGKR